MTNLQDRRRFARIPFRAVVTTRSRDQEREVELLDISLKGALISRPAGCEAEVGDELEFELRLEEGTVIRMAMRVAHHRPDRIGLSCESIDIDSVTHLRRLVEINLGDADQVKRELGALIG